jgi:hypothetical protein
MKWKKGMRKKVGVAYLQALFQNLRIIVEINEKDESECMQIQELTDA